MCAAFTHKSVVNARPTVIDVNVSGFRGYGFAKRNFDDIDRSGEAVGQTGQQRLCVCVCVLMLNANTSHTMSN